MALEAAFVGQGGAAQGVLQSGDGFVVARTFGCVRRVLEVVLQERLHFGATDIERTGEVQGNIGRVVGPALAVFIRPVIEQLPLVSAFFRHLNCGFLHKSQKWEPLRAQTPQEKWRPPITRQTARRLTRINEFFILNGLAHVFLGFRGLPLFWLRVQIATKIRCSTRPLWPYFESLCMSSAPSHASEDHEHDPIEDIIPMMPIVLPIGGAVLMFLLAFIAVNMA